MPCLRRLIMFLFELQLFESDADAQIYMKTTHIGTRGYQAPELILNTMGSYDLSCDIFSVGVILFILLTGYRPFGEATYTDRWYKSMTKKDYKKFWKAHRASPLVDNEKAKDLIQRMLYYDPKERIGITDIKRHEWFNGEYLQGKDLIRTLRTRHCEMEIKRKKDGRKQNELSSNHNTRPIDFTGVISLPLLPDYIDETIGMLHTTVDWQHVYGVIHDTVGSVGGVSNWDGKSMKLNCEMNVAMQSNLTNISTVEFSIQIFLSRLYNDDKVFDAMKKLATFESENQRKTLGININDKSTSSNESKYSDIEKLRMCQMLARQSNKPCYAIKIVRISGDEVIFQTKIKKKLILGTVR